MDKVVGMCTVWRRLCFENLRKNSPGLCLGAALFSSEDQSRQQGKSGNGSGGKLLNDLRKKEFDDQKCRNCCHSSDRDPGDF